eukprot:Rhum_TRINITY_DN7352_c0_g1::Rhum_TRINITY_DN7352_c0_g1_i1::g.22677::m.22677
MEEWDAYLTGSRGKGCVAPGSLDDVFGGLSAGSPSPVTAGDRGASPVLFSDELFGSGAPTPTPDGGAPGGPAAAAGGKPACKNKAAAEDFMQGFMGSTSGAKKNQTLASLQKQKEGEFLDIHGSGQKPQSSSSPNMFMQSIMNYYEVLGVAELCTQEDIKAVYKKKSWELHPDRNPNAHEDDQAMFKLITKAYSTLSDPTLRAQYDIELRMKNQASMPQPGAAGGSWLNHLAKPAGPMGGGGAGGGMGGFPNGGMGMGPSPGVSPPPHARPASSPATKADPFSGLF